MPGKGAMPKAERSRARDTSRRASEFTTVEADGEVRGPELPVGIWPDSTVAMYEALRVDPAASLWTEADWRHLVDTMGLHRELVTGNHRLAAEVRLRLAQFGVTPEARQRLRLMVAPPAPPAPAPVPINRDRMKQALRLAGYAAE